MERFNRMSLQARLYLGFGLVVVLFVGLVLYMTNAAHEVEGAMTDALEQEHHAVEVREAEQHLMKANATALEAALAADDAELEQLRSDTDEQLAALEEVLSGMETSTDAGAEDVAAFEQAVGEVAEVWDEQFQLRLAGQDAEAASLMNGTGAELEQEAEAAAEEAVDHYATRAEEVQAGAEEQAASMDRTDLIAGALIVLAAGAIAWFITRDASRSVTRSTESVSAASEELGSVSAQMSSNAEETASQANVVAAAGEQVSNNVQTVATAVEEMNATVQEISSNTAEASKVANNAVTKAESTNETVSKLGESSQEIGKVIEVITNIAEQTNLLALNATIEAARAGEAGKGFAVVANEVKELANQTSKATEDIRERIKAIQTDTEGAVNDIGEIGGVINQIADIQNTIASAVEEQTATTNEIGRNINEAAQGSSEIAQNIASVAEAARQTSDGAAAVQRHAGGLRQATQELRSLVGQHGESRAQGAHAEALVLASPHAPGGNGHVGGNGHAGPAAPAMTGLGDAGEMQPSANGGNGHAVSWGNGHGGDPEHQPTLVG